MKFKHPPAFKVYLTSPFGPRGDGFHSGVDFRAVLGTPLFAVEDGKAVAVRTVDQDASGLYVVIECTNGVKVSYAHLSKCMVKTGAKVSAGELIGFSGQTGRSRGPHVHFRTKVQDGDKWVDVDPEDYLDLT